LRKGESHICSLAVISAWNGFDDDNAFDLFRGFPRHLAGDNGANILSCDQEWLILIREAQEMSGLLLYRQFRVEIRADHRKITRESRRDSVPARVGFRSSMQQHDLGPMTATAEPPM
jgi:hypothetical protein